MLIEERKSLKKLNTLNVDCKADKFVEIYTKKDLAELTSSLPNLNSEILILGGGSNILFTKNFKGLVVHSKIESITSIHEGENEIILKVGSGVEWDKFVSYCVDRNWGGVENLSDIPGSVGAAPVQNIGAYGTEAKDTIVKVHAFNLAKGVNLTFDNKDCKFGYRYSIFKEDPYNQLFISHVEFRLQKAPKLNTSYGRVEEELQKYSAKNLKNLRNAIISIRKSKLPPVSEIASAGSFFKNPVLEDSKAKLLLEKFPDIPNYDAGQGKIKFAAAWFIESCGLKGMQRGNVGTYKNQPLVIINHNNATGQEIVEFSAYIQKEVYNNFGIKLEPEVCFI